MAPDRNARTGARYETRCRLCGRTLSSIRGKKPREACYDCARFRSHYNAAVRHLDEIEFLDDHSARKMRADLIALANRLPVRWQRPRDEGGRFLPASPNPPRPGST